MKNLKYLFLLLLSIVIFSCEEEEDPSSNNDVPVQVNETSIIPSTTNGRPNVDLGCIEISERFTTIKVWDHQTIDGDIVTIVANGNTIIDQQVLDGPGNPIVVNYDFGNNGFNYVTLIAENLGDLPPNTCAISINDTEFVLQANLEENGAVNVVVTGYGVDCSNAGGGGGGSGGGGGGGSDTGDVVFWTDADYGCGPITVNVTGEGSSTMTSFFSSAPDCGTSGGANFGSLSPGSYSFTASCQGIDWSGSFDITANQCLQYQLVSSGGGGGGGNGTGDVKFWIAQDFGCGNISVNVSGVGSSAITGFFTTAPDCSNTGGGGNFDNLSPGTYSYTASCQGIDWSGNFTVTEDECLRFQLIN